jgi:hypothetical protein
MVGTSLDAVHITLGGTANHRDGISTIRFGGQALNEARCRALPCWYRVM